MLYGLGALGVASMSGALGSNYSEEAHAENAGTAEHQWCRVVDLRKCTGQRKCVKLPNATWPTA